MGTPTVTATMTLPRSNPDNKLPECASKKEIASSTTVFPLNLSGRHLTSELYVTSPSMKWGIIAPINTRDGNGVLNNGSFHFRYAGYDKHSRLVGPRDFGVYKTRGANLVH